MVSFGGAPDEQEGEEAGKGSAQNRLTIGVAVAADPSSSRGGRDAQVVLIASLKRATHRQRVVLRRASDISLPFAVRRVHGSANCWRWAGGPPQHRISFVSRSIPQLQLPVLSQTSSIGGTVMTGAASPAQLEKQETSSLMSLAQRKFESPDISTQSFPGTGCQVPVPGTQVGASSSSAQVISPLVPNPQTCLPSPARSA